MLKSNGFFEVQFNCIIIDIFTLHKGKHFLVSILGFIAIRPYYISIHLQSSQKARYDGPSKPPPGNAHAEAKYKLGIKKLFLNRLLPACGLGWVKS